MSFSTMIICKSVIAIAIICLRSGFAITKKSGFIYLFFVFLFLPAILSPESANADQFADVSNWGGTGLLETPNARVLQEGQMRAGMGQVDPYRFYYMAVSPLKRFEVGLRLTEVLGVPALSANYGNTKDKALDFKYQFLPESKWLPALALGIMDSHGTRKYPAQYIAASKKISLFDFTVGFGNGRFGKRPLPAKGEGLGLEIFSDFNSWIDEGQFFGGIQFAFMDNLSVLAEYSPIKYEVQKNDSAQAKYFRDPVRSPFNFGLRWRPWNWLSATLMYQRGEQIGLNFAFNYDLPNPLIPIYNHPYKEMPDYRLNPWEERIVRGLVATGFRNIVIHKYMDELYVEAENDKYYYTPRALGMMLRTVTDLSPAEVRSFRLILTNNGIPLVSFSCRRDDAVLFHGERLTAQDFLSVAKIDTKLSEGLTGRRHNPNWWDYGFAPSLRMFLNDPSGFFKYRFGARGWLSAYPWKGGTLAMGMESYPLNTVSTSNAPSPTAVRSDIVQYQQNNAALGILLGEQIKKFPHEIYGKLTAGILEIQYTGLDGEVAMPLLDGRFMAGISGSIVQKRDPDNILGLKKNDYKSTYHTAFFNLRLNIPEAEVSVDLKSGQFLAGDRGTLVTLSKFFNGVVLSAWYSFTDTNMFTDPSNRGYNEKGISITIPLRHFKGTDSRTVYSFGISPWTRDVAQDISHFTSLFDYIGRNSQIFLKKDALSGNSTESGLN